MTSDRPSPGPPDRYGYGYPPPTVHVQTDSALAPVTSLVLGIVSLLVAWIPLVGIVAWLTAPVGLVFGSIGLRRGRAEHKAMSTIGIVLSAVALLICVGYVLLIVGVMSTSSSP